MTLHSPLSGPVNSGFGGGKKYKSKIVFGVAVMGFVPFLFSTFAASVTVGNGALEFGQGSQQAIACDEKFTSHSVKSGMQLLLRTIHQLVTSEYEQSQFQI